MKDDIACRHCCRTVDLFLATDVLLSVKRTIEISFLWKDRKKLVSVVVSLCWWRLRKMHRKRQNTSENYCKLSFVGFLVGP